MVISVFATKQSEIKVDMGYRNASYFLSKNLLIVLHSQNHKKKNSFDRFHLTISQNYPKFKCYFFSPLPQANGGLNLDLNGSGSVTIHISDSRNFDSTLISVVFEFIFMLLFSRSPLQGS